LVGDGAGNVLGWQVRAGQAGDAPEAADLLSPWLAPAQEIVADAAYDRDELRAVIAEAGATAVIKPNPRRKKMPQEDAAF
jgi:transposase